MRHRSDRQVLAVPHPQTRARHGPRVSIAISRFSIQFSSAGIADGELRPFVYLCPLPGPGAHLPPLRPGQHLLWSGVLTASPARVTLLSQWHGFGHSRCLFRDILRTANQHLDDGRIFRLQARLNRCSGWPRENHNPAQFIGCNPDWSRSTFSPPFESDSPCCADTAAWAYLA